MSILAITTLSPLRALALANVEVLSETRTTPTMFYLLFERWRTCL